PSAPTSWNEPATPRAGAPAAAAPQAAAPQRDAEDWTPVEGRAAAGAADAGTPGDIRSVPVTGQAGTVPRHDVFNAAEGLFGRGARGLAGILENILRDQGEPVAYISGQEASGAF